MAVTDYETLDQLGRTLAQDIVARRVHPAEGAYLIWQRVCEVDWALMHDYQIFAGLASEWDDSAKSKDREEYRAQLAEDIVHEARRIIAREAGAPN